MEESDMIITWNQRWSQLPSGVYWQRRIIPRMHGRGSQAGAPASDAAGRGDVGGTPQTARPSRVVPRRATWRIPTRADAAKTGADAAKIGPTRSVSAVSAISAGDRYGRNRPKSAVKIVGEAEILASDAFLALFILCFVNQVY